MNLFKEQLLDNAREMRALDGTLRDLTFAKEQIEIISASKVTALNTQLAYLAGNKTMVSMSSETDMGKSAALVGYAQRATETAIEDITKAKQELSAEGFKEVMAKVGKKIMEILRWIENYIREFFSSPSYKRSSASVEETISNMNSRKPNADLIERWSRKGFKRKLDDHEMPSHDESVLTLSDRNWAASGVYYIFTGSPKQSLTTNAHRQIHAMMVGEGDTIDRRSYANFIENLDHDLDALTTCVNLIDRGEQGYVTLRLYGSFEISGDNKAVAVKKDISSPNAYFKIIPADGNISDLGNYFSTSDKVVADIKKMISHLNNAVRNATVANEADSPMLDNQSLLIGVLQTYSEYAVSYYRALSAYIIGSGEIASAKLFMEGKK